MSVFIIRRADGKFWSDIGRWSFEYPDAFVFSSWKKAAQEAMDSVNIQHGWAEILADYGTASERVVLKVNASILGEKEAA